jgi:hypothetical protein
VANLYDKAIELQYDLFYTVTSTMEFLSMTSGNGLPAASECDEDEGVRPSELDSRSLRDIENLVARLKVVNKQLWTRKIGASASPSPSREADEPTPQK